MAPVFAGPGRSRLASCNGVAESLLRAADEERVRHRQARRRTQLRGEHRVANVGTALARWGAMALTLAMLALGLLCFVSIDQLVRRS